jgi:hypothetical protein
MLNVTTIRSADEQCREYVDKERRRRRRAAADRAVSQNLDKLADEYGPVLVLGALMRYVGELLVEAHDRWVIVSCRRYLLRKIARSLVKHLLTRAHVLH